MTVRGLEIPPAQISVQILSILFLITPVTIGCLLSILCFSKLFYLPHKGGSISYINIVRLNVYRPYSHRVCQTIFSKIIISIRVDVQLSAAIIDRNKVSKFYSRCITEHLCFPFCIGRSRAEHFLIDRCGIFPSKGNRKLRVSL